MEINEHHIYYIPVYAAVNELSLDLSSNTVTLCEPPYSNVNAGTFYHYVYFISPIHNQYHNFSSSHSPH